MALETTVNDLDDKITSRVKAEVKSSTWALREDMDVLERKVDDIKVNLRDAEESYIQANVDNRSLIIKNMTVENEEELLQCVFELIMDMLGVSVTIEEAFRFKAYGKRVTPIKVTLRTLEEKVEVLRNKWKLSELDAYKNIRIEACASRSDVTNKQNWNLLLSACGDIGKVLRVSGNGRLLRKKPKGPEGRRSGSGMTWVAQKGLGERANPPSTA